MLERDISGGRKILTNDAATIALKTHRPQIGIIYMEAQTSNETFPLAMS